MSTDVNFKFAPNRAINERQYSEENLSWNEMLSTNFIHSNSKLEVICKNLDMECHYISTHIKEEEPSDTKFAILPFYQKKYPS